MLWKQLIYFCEEQAHVNNSVYSIQYVECLKVYFIKSVIPVSHHGE